LGVENNIVAEVIQMKALVGILVLMSVVWGCTPSEPPAPAAAPTEVAPVAEQAPAAETKEYKLEGEIVSVDKEKKAAVIKHGDIEGYMGAMTMPYPVPEEVDLAKIKPGDKVTATVYDNKAEGKYWVGNIEVAK
jgi:protein SCO1